MAGRPEGAWPFECCRLAAASHHPMRFDCNC